MSEKNNLLNQYFTNKKIISYIWSKKLKTHFSKCLAPYTQAYIPYLFVKFFDTKNQDISYLRIQRPAGMLRNAITLCFDQWKIYVCKIFAPPYAPRQMSCFVICFEYTNIHPYLIHPHPPKHLRNACSDMLSDRIGEAHKQQCIEEGKMSPDDCVNLWTVTKSNTDSSYQELAMA